MRTLWRYVLALLVIWTLSAGAVLALRWTRSTPQKFVAYVTAHPLQGRAASDRGAIIERAARLLNGLNSEQRREVKRSGSLRSFFAQLTSEERRHFATLTLPAGFRQMIVTLNKMEPAARKRVVERTLRDLRRQSAMASDLADEDDIREMLTKGASIFDEVASPEVKRDFAPLFEEYRQRQKSPTAGAELPAL